MSLNKKSKRRSLDILEKNKLRGARRQKIRRYFVLIFWIIMLIVFGWLFCSAKLTFREVKVSSSGAVDSLAVKQVAQKIFSERQFLLVPKSSVLFYPRKELKEKIFAIDKRIDEVRLVKGQDRTLIIYLNERVPLALWCQASSGEKICFYLDRHGVVFAQAPILSSPNLLEFNAASSSVAIGDKPIPGLDYPRVLQLAKDLQKVAQSELEKTINIKVVNIWPYGDLAFRTDFKVASLTPFLILVNTRLSAGATLDNFNSLLASEIFRQDLVKNNLINLDYIDLRFGNKVFYKWRQNKSMD